MIFKCCALPGFLWHELQLRLEVKKTRIIVERSSLAGGLNILDALLEDFASFSPQAKKMLIRRRKSVALLYEVQQCPSLCGGALIYINLALIMHEIEFSQGGVFQLSA